MTQEKLQTILEMERQQLVDIISSVGCTPWEAAQFAIEEYFIGEPNGDYNYHNFRQHYINRYLKDSRHDGTLHFRFGTALTEVLQHLFDVQISKGYIAIKKAVYEKMDQLKKDDELWEFGKHIADFENWASAWTEYFCDGEDEIVDINWNIKKKKQNSVGVK